MQIDLNDKNYNPFEDKTLKETQPETPNLVDDDREPFNDVIKHGDFVLGYRRNRTLSDYPKRVRPWVRLWAIGMVVVIVGSLVFQLVHILT